MMASYVVLLPSYAYTSLADYASNGMPSLIDAVRFYTVAGLSILTNAMRAYEMLSSSRVTVDSRDPMKRISSSPTSVSLP